MIPHHQSCHRSHHEPHIAREAHMHMASPRNGRSDDASRTRQTPCGGRRMPVHYGARAIDPKGDCQHARTPQSHTTPHHTHTHPSSTRLASTSS